MPSFEAIVFFLVFASLAVIGLLLLVALRSRRTSPAGRLLEAGEFRAALEAVDSATDPDPADLLAGVRAARQLLEIETARRWVDRLLENDPVDGEAWLELALIAAYARDPVTARQAFDRAAATRTDLLESLTLHRAWMELFTGDIGVSKRLFEEIEAPLTTKLRDDLGPDDPTFSEWFLHTGCLWRQRGDREKAEWALAAARAAAPESRLPDLVEDWWRERD